MKKSLVLRKFKGFTMIEILVVTTIIALLSGIATISYTQLSKQSRDARRKTDLEQVRAALEMYRSNNNSYPIGDWGSLSVLSQSPVYLQSLPTDPKDTTYDYYYSGSSSDYTLGAYLEQDSSSCSVTISCGTAINCNYCLSPYGKK